MYQKNSIYDDVKSKIRLEDVVAYYFNKTPYRRNVSYSIQCPFHDDHNPSLVIMPRVQRFQCFSCGAKGDVITFVKKMEMKTHPNFTAYDAINKISEITNIKFSIKPNEIPNIPEVPFEEDVFTTLLPYDQLSDRNKEEYMKQLLEICLYNKWLLYNFDSVKEILFWSTRHDSIAVVISKDNSVKCVKYYKTYKFDPVKKRYSDERTDGKWINEAGMSFGYTYKIFNEDDPVCIVEGVHDLITMELLNMNYICLESAQTTLENKRELRWLIEKRKILWIGDNDEPGKQSYEKNKNILRYKAYELQKLNWEELEDEYNVDLKDITDFVCLFPDTSSVKEDFFKYTKQLRSYLFKNFVDRKAYIDISKDFGGDIEYLTPTDRTLYSLPFGYPVIFYGRGASGKTTLMLHYALEVILNTNKRVFLWLSEDTNSRIVRSIRNIINWKYPDKKDYLAAELSKRAVFATDEMVPVSLIGIGFNREPKLTASYYNIRKEFKEFDFVVFDPLTWFISESDMNNNTYMSFFFRNMRQWAVEEKKCLIFLHHQTKARDVEDGMDRVMGASSIVNNVRLVFRVSNDLQSGMGFARLKIEKDNLNVLYRDEGFIDLSTYAGRSVELYRVNR